MAQRYLPKIKVSTAKNIAKGLLATPTGKKISDTRFSKFLKKDSDLKKYYYSSDSHRLSKVQAKKFFTQVTKSAKAQPTMKISALAAKKMGIRLNRDKEVSNLGLNRIYQKAATQEYEASQPTGPTKAEQEQQRRHDRAVKALHRRDRAEEIRKDPFGNPAKPTEEKKASVPPPRAGFGMTAVTNKGTGIPATKQGNIQTNTSGDDTPPLVRLLILPLTNQTPSVGNLEFIVQKISHLTKQVLASLRIFSIIDYDLASGDEKSAGALMREKKADLMVSGTVSKIGEFINIKIVMQNAASGEKLTLAAINEKEGDIFQLGRKVSWQITNALQNEAPPAEKNTPDSDGAVDLPI